MSANPERENSIENGFANQAVRTRLDAIADGMIEGMEQDTRLASGVPQAQRSDALDFIQMSGLTRPAATLCEPSTAPARPAVQPADGMDPTRPVSFYEKGVADVDHTMGPAAMESTIDAAQENLIPPPPPLPQPNRVPSTIQPSKSVDALKAIIAELTGESDDTIPKAEPEEPAHQDVVAHPELAEKEEEESDSILGGLDVASGEDIAPVNDPPDTPIEDASLKSQDLELAPALPAEEPQESAPHSEESEVDFDSLLEQSDIAETAPIIDEPAAAALTDEVSRADGDLQQAEQLLEELAGQPRSEGATTQEASGDERQAFGMNYDLSVAREDSPNRWEWPEQEASESLAEEPVIVPHHRSHQHRGWKRRMLRRLPFFVAVCFVIAGVVFAYINVIAPSLYQPEDLRDVAAAHIASRRFVQASEAYITLANKYPKGSPERGEALFNAAQWLYQSPQTSGPGAEARYNKILGYLRDFTDEQPRHPKRVRANLLIGVALYKTGVYDEAITILQKAANEPSDPIATLPALRSLARAYTKTKDYAQAESTYLRAISLIGNYSMDVDYYELGQVYSVQAATEDNESIKTQLLRNAEVNWMKATQVPAIDPVRRDEILREITSLMAEDKNGTVLELTTESATAVPVPGATADTVGHEVEQSELEALGDTRVSLE